MAEIDISLFSIPNELIPVFISLIMTGKCESHRAFYKNHATINNATHLVLEVNLPSDRSKKGIVKLLPIEGLHYDEPKLVPEMRTYPKRTYMNHNIYLHPDHDIMSGEIKRAQQGDVNEKVGLVIIMGRGCYTFKV